MIRINWLRKTRNNLYRRRLSSLRTRLNWKKKELDLRANIHEHSHSLMWVWEFSKKVVLICFLFYIAVQVYSMVVMVKYCDFTHLGELISQTGQIVRDCIFGYLVKAGVENVGKIIFSDNTDDDEAVG